MTDLKTTADTDSYEPNIDAMLQLLADEAEYEPNIDLMISLMSALADA